jgi:general secretion pathway protein C
MPRRLTAPHLACIVLVALLCAITAGWAMVLLSPQPAIAPATSATEPPHGMPLEGIAPLFGQISSTATPSSMPTIVVTGVLAAPGAGVALLSVDGRPPKPFVLNASVTETIKVSAIAPDRVDLQHPGGIVRLAPPVRASMDVLTRGRAPQSDSSVTAPPAVTPPRSASFPDENNAAGRPSAIPPPTLPLNPNPPSNLQQ